MHETRRYIPHFYSLCYTKDGGAQLTVRDRSLEEDKHTEGTELPDEGNVSMNESSATSSPSCTHTASGILSFPGDDENNGSNYFVIIPLLFSSGSLSIEYQLNFGNVFMLEGK